MKGIKKRIAFIIMSLILVLGCAGSFTGCKKSEPVIKIWAANYDLVMTQKFADDFAAENPDFGYKLVVAEGPESEAATNLKNDPNAAADVVHIPHDQLGVLTQGSGFIHEIPAQSTMYTQVTTENSEKVVDVAKVDGKLYGFPTILETSLLYYNSSIFTPDDVTSFEKMFAKASTVNNNNFRAFGMDIRNGFYSGMFNLGAGNYLYKNNDVSQVSFATNAGVAAAKYLRDMNGAKKAKNIPDASTASTDFSASNLGSYVSGPWAKSEFKQALGDKMAIATLPTFNITVDGEVLTCNPQALASVKMYVINKKTADTEAAMKVAQYLSSKQIQLKKYDEMSYIPSNKDFANDDAFASDKMAQTIFAQLENSVMQPSVVEMASRWYKNPGAQMQFYTIFANAEGVAGTDEKIMDILLKLETFLKTGNTDITLG